MGAAVTSQPQFSASNYVLDYSIDLMHPDRFGQIMQRSGPNMAAFPEQGRTQVLNDLSACLNSGDPQLVQNYARHRQYAYLAIALFVLGPILFFLLLVSSENGYSFSWPFMIIAFVAGMILQCRVAARQRALGLQWRTDIVSKLQAKMAMTWR